MPQHSLMSNPNPMPPHTPALKRLSSDVNSIRSSKSWKNIV